MQTVTRTQIERNTDQIEAVNWNSQPQFQVAEQEYLTIRQDANGNRWHWLHVRPSGFSGTSRESFPNAVDAALAAISIARWCGPKPLPVRLPKAILDEMESPFYSNHIHDDLVQEVA